MRRIWREFWSRHRSVWEHIEFHDEGFWTDLEDVAGQVRRARWTTEGAVVREWPATRDAPAQATPEEGVARVTQTSPPEPTRRSPTQPTPRERTSSPEDQAGSGPRRFRPEPAAERPPRGVPCGVGCWNCGSPRHPYAECPLPRTGSFCYGCGQQGVTLRGCGRCGGAYRRATPYTAGRGPRAPRPPPLARDDSPLRDGWPWEREVEKGGTNHTAPP
ncbi:Gag protein [Camponotus japonicus]